MEYSLKQAAELLNISESTARRWIKTGRLAAIMQEGSYGPEYVIDDEAINQAREFEKTPIVVTGQQMSVTREEFYKIIQTSVDQALATRMGGVAQGVHHEVNSLREEIDDLKSIIKEQHDQLDAAIARRDKLLVETIKERLEERKPWYKRLFGR